MTERGQQAGAGEGERETGSEGAAAPQTEVKQHTSGWLRRHWVQVHKQ